MYNDPKTTVSQNSTHPVKQHVSVLIITLQGEAMISESSPSAIFLSHIFVLSTCGTLNDHFTRYPFVPKKNKTLLAPVGIYFVGGSQRYLIGLKEVFTNYRPQKKFAAR